MLRLARRSAGRPLCRTPKKSPGPRSSRSFSARQNPSCVSSMAFSRSHVVLVCGIVRRSGVGEQQAVRLVCASAHPAPELVQLGQAKAVGAFDQHDRGIGHVDAHLDHRGGDQDVESRPRGSRSSPAPFPCPSSGRGAVPAADRGRWSAAAARTPPRRPWPRPCPTPRPRG